MVATETVMDMTHETSAEPITDVIPVTTGVRLAYRRVGTGEPLLLISATSCSLGLWAPLEPALAARHHVISFDNRGLGGSERGEGPLSIASMADDSAALLDALKVPRAHVLGWSLGSAVAQELALRHPDRVGKLVLCGTWAELDRYGTALLIALRAPWVLGDLQMALTSSALVFSPEFVNSEQFEPMMKSLRPLFPSSPEQMRVVVEQFDANLAHNTRGRLGAITAPTLVLAGEHDLLTPASKGRSVAQAIPGAEFKIVGGPGSSHGMLLERPEETLGLVLEFLGQAVLKS
jgi:pimeloyl-ACP methyl ester carboxylesterase